jgi:predicted nucleic acid-binding protein
MPPAAEPYGSGGALVFDTSAWNRRTDPAVLPRWAATRDGGLLAACPVVALELLAAARDEQAFRALDRALRALLQAPVTRGACERALSASRELAGERRLPAADYLIAASAAERGFAVLHYDRHFELLCHVLGVDSVLIAPRGELD